MSAGSTACWPVELRLKQAEKVLEISFDDGNSFSLPAEYLRVESPSAEVQGHGPGQKTLVYGRARVGIIGLEPVGNYAVRIIFDDLHDTGIYSGIISTSSVSSMTGVGGSILRLSPRAARPACHNRRWCG